jgi:hypothetical protein
MWRAAFCDWPAAITPDDRAYLVRLVASVTGIAQPDAERRVDEAIVGATTAMERVRRSGIILGFSTAVSLTGRGSCGVVRLVRRRRDRDHVAPSLAWRWPQHA